MKATIQKHGSQLSRLRPDQPATNVGSNGNAVAESNSSVVEAAAPLPSSSNLATKSGHPTRGLRTILYMRMGISVTPVWVGAIEEVRDVVDRVREKRRFRKAVFYHLNVVPTPAALKSARRQIQRHLEGKSHDVEAIFAAGLAAAEVER